MGSNCKKEERGQQQEQPLHTSSYITMKTSNNKMNDDNDYNMSSSSSSIVGDTGAKQMKNEYNNKNKNNNNNNNNSSTVPMASGTPQHLCELTMLNTPSDNILSSRVFIERLNQSHKLFLKLLLSDEAVMKEITTRTVMKADQSESVFEKTFEQLYEQSTTCTMGWWILRTRGTKGLGAIGLTRDDNNKVIIVEQLVRPEIQNTTLAAEALYTLARVYEELARRGNSLSDHYEYKLLVTSSVAGNISDLMSRFNFSKICLSNGKIHYEMKTGDFYNNSTYKTKSSLLKQTIDAVRASDVLPPNYIYLVHYTQLKGRQLDRVPYRGLINFVFNPVWKREKICNQLPALGCNKQHLIGTVTFHPPRQLSSSNEEEENNDKSNASINWSECYLCVYLIKRTLENSNKSPFIPANCIVYQAKRNKRDGYPLVFSQFGFKRSVDGSLVSEIKLQPKSQVFDENGRHARIYCLIELWYHLTKLDQYETDEFYTHSEDRKKKTLSNDGTMEHYTSFQYNNNNIGSNNHNNNNISNSSSSNRNRNASNDGPNNSSSINTRSRSRSNSSATKSNHYSPMTINTCSVNLNHEPLVSTHSNLSHVTCAFTNNNSIPSRPRRFSDTAIAPYPTSSNVGSIHAQQTSTRSHNELSPMPWTPCPIEQPFHFDKIHSMRATNNALMHYTPMDRIPCPAHFNKCSSLLPAPAPPSVSNGFTNYLFESKATYTPTFDRLPSIHYLLQWIDEPAQSSHRQLHPHGFSTPPSLLLPAAAAAAAVPAAATTLPCGHKERNSYSEGTEPQYPPSQQHNDRMGRMHYASEQYQPYGSHYSELHHQHHYQQHPHYQQQQQRSASSTEHVDSYGNYSYNKRHHNSIY
jgi:hypothetical protein